MSSSLPIATEPTPPPPPTEQAGPPRVASYSLSPDDPAKAEALRARLAAYQRSLGLPLGVYEERCRDRRRRPLRARLLHRAAGGGIDIVVVPAVRHLASTRARVCQLVCRLDVPVLTLTGLRFDPSDRIVRWVARACPQRLPLNRRIKK